MNLERYQGFIKTSVSGKPVPLSTFNISKPLQPMNWANMESVRDATRRDLARPFHELNEEIDEFNKRVSGFTHDTLDTRARGEDFR